MTMTVGMRDLARSSNILDGYDYVDVEDKKTHEYKGLFISPKYADEFKKLLEAKISQEKQNMIERINKFSGKGEVYSKFDNLTSKEIKVKVAKAKYGKE